MGNRIEVRVPDIGDFDGVEIIEISVGPQAVIDAEDTLITLESDKSTMDIPSPASGKVCDMNVAVGDTVSMGDLILTLEASGEKTTADTTVEIPAAETQAENAIESENRDDSPPPPSQSLYKPAPLSKTPASGGAKPHASPSVRKFARELGVALPRVSGSGAKGRILKSDVEGFIKNVMSADQPSTAGTALLPEMPVIDFSQFGNTEVVALSKIQKLTGSNLHRSWVRVPHVTQFDEADITDLEKFRKALAPEAESRGVKVTFLAFLLKAVVAVLKSYPRFNSSLDASGEKLIMKNYFHLGFACDTPDGLVVPVIRDVDQKGIFDLAVELSELSQKARKKQLSPKEMQGGCFTISSLGGIGGTAFTPIVNAPEVAILGVSRSAIKPVHVAGEFVPRMMLPLSLSYDHRVIDGANAARFTTELSRVLTDMRRVLL